MVGTANYNDTPSLTRASRDLRVVERSRWVDERTLIYSFAFCSVIYGRFIKNY
ncbi:MAG: hypothetical protein R3E82_10800 [Pseudomonadales bacterium]|nr:hypothetical protein [Pseudomonadales bacterium]